VANNPKTITGIEPYVPGVTPVLGSEMTLKTYLSNEFKKISYPLHTLAEYWQPTYQIALHGAVLPTALNSTVAAVTNYADVTISQRISNKSVSVDQVTGEIDLGASAMMHLQQLVKVDCSMIMERSSGTNNTTLLMHLIIDGVSQVIASAFSSNQTSHLSMYGGFLGAINSDAVVSIGLSYEGSAVVSHINSFFDLQVLGVIEV